MINRRIRSLALSVLGSISILMAHPTPEEELDVPQAGNIETVKSPDGNLQVELSVKNGQPVYTVSYKNKVMLEESSLGLMTHEGDFSRNMKFIGRQTDVVSKQYSQEKIKK